MASCIEDLQWRHAMTSSTDIRHIVSIGPEKLPIFGRFLTIFPLKRHARREKNTSNMAATVDDVMDDVTASPL
jgi:hypothetical protein